MKCYASLIRATAKRLANLVHAYRTLIGWGCGKVWLIGFAMGFGLTVANARVAADPETWPLTLEILRCLHAAGWETAGTMAPVKNGWVAACGLAFAPPALLLASMLAYAVVLWCGLGVALLLWTSAPVWASMSAAAVQAGAVFLALRALQRRSPVLADLARGLGAVVGATLASLWFFAQFLPALSVLLACLQLLFGALTK